MKNQSLKNIALIGCNPNDGNRGVGALAYSTIFLLNKISKEINIKFNVFIIINGFKLDKTYKFKFFDNEVETNILHQLDFMTIKKIIKSFIFFKEIKTYIKLDYILDIGLGDCFSDIYGKDKFYSINNSKRFFKIINKKQLLLPQTIGPFTNNQLKHKAIKSIEGAEIVMLRDKLSYEFVKNNTIHKKIYELIDVAFFMPYEKNNFDTKFIHVGIGISALLWNGGYTQNNQFQLKLDYRELCLKIINYFSEIENVIIHLVPHVVVNNSSIENDYEVSQLIYNKYNNSNIVLSPFFLNPILAKNYISGLDFFVGARMHACIAAFSSGVPVFPIAYSRKFTGLFVETLDYKFVGDMTSNSENSIIEELKNSFVKRDELKLIIKNSMNGIVKEKFNELIRILTTFLIS